MPDKNVQATLTIQEHIYTHIHTHSSYTLCTKLHVMMLHTWWLQVAQWSPEETWAVSTTLGHFVHLLWVLSVSDPAELSILEVHRNGKKMKWKTMVTTRTKRAPSWLQRKRRSYFGTHKKSTWQAYLSRNVRHFLLRLAGVASRFASVTSAKWLR